MAEIGFVELQNNSPAHGQLRKKHLVLVGGFLGAGKTTLIGKLVRHLQLTGLRCGVVTNDQATGLVDTALAESLDGAAISEIAGGCFCCKLTELESMLTGQWQDQPESAPDVIIAEPVGSCTDLVATVILPLRQTFGDSVTVCPLSVVLDGRRALASLGGRRLPGDLSKDVGYIYRKQIEEAEIVVINKKDLLGEDDLADLMSRIDSNFPGKETFVLSARKGEGLEVWATHILGAETNPQLLMDVDYVRYGLGEALLGWCNAEVDLECVHAEDGDQLLNRVAVAIAAALKEQGAEVAHFKMSLADEEGRLGVINQVISGVEPEISKSFGGSLRHGRLTVNLRAEGDPAELQETVQRAVAQLSEGPISARLRDLAAFRPGQPVPVKRVTELSNTAL